MHTSLELKNICREKVFVIYQSTILITRIKTSLFAACQKDAVEVTFPLTEVLRRHNPALPFHIHTSTTLKCLQTKVNIERIKKRKKCREKKKGWIKKEKHSNQVVEELSGRKSRGTPS